MSDASVREQFFYSRVCFLLPVYGSRDRQDGGSGEEAVAPREARGRGSTRGNAAEDTTGVSGTTMCVDSVSVSARFACRHCAISCLSNC